ncbi:MAG: phasin family protein [Magnetococcales bacterium]|nr:phasin family protein [Magnetococcales bacterium]
MDNKIAEQLTSLTKNMMESMKELQTINEKTMQNLTDQQFKTAQSFVKTSTEQLELLGKAKSVEQAVSEQVKITSTIGQMMLDNAQATMKVLTAGQKDLEELITKTVKANMDDKAGV